MVQDYCAYRLKSAIEECDRPMMHKYFGRAGPGRTIQNSKALLFAAKHNMAAFDEMLRISHDRVKAEVEQERAENQGTMHDIEIHGRNITPWDFDRTGPDWAETEARAERIPQMKRSLDSYKAKIAEMDPAAQRRQHAAAPAKARRPAMG